MKLDLGRLMTDIQLTQRERQCLLLTACGLREAEIAEELRISPHTVRVHLVNAKKRLGASNKPHSIILALMTNNLNLVDIMEMSRFRPGNSAPLTLTPRATSSYEDASTSLLIKEN